MEIVNINLIPGLNNPVCHVSQFDVGRTIRLNLYEGSSVYTLSGTETIKLNVRKPDNKVLVRDVINTSSTYVTFNTTEQMCPLPGENLCELSISSGGTVIKSINFIMLVECDPLYKGVETESAIENLDSQIFDTVSHMTFNFGLHATYIDIKTDIFSYTEMNYSS